MFNAIILQNITLHAIFEIGVPNCAVFVSFLRAMTCIAEVQQGTQQ